MQDDAIKDYQDAFLKKLKKKFLKKKFGHLARCEIFFE